MIESEILSWLVYGFLGDFSFRFSQKFLHEKFLRQKFRSRLSWISIFILGEIAIFYATNLLFPYNSFATIFPTAILIFLLQRIFFENDLARQIFLIMNFIAAWEVLKFLASPLSALILRLWNPIFENLAYSIENLDLIVNLNRAVVFGVLVICRTIQLGIFVAYLNFIDRKFPHDYALKLEDARLLALPCITVLIVDLTLRLMAVSVVNGAAQLIYDRVPSVLILLPISSLLLLGILAIHVNLFRNLIRRMELEIQSQKMRHDFRDRLATIQALEQIQLPNWLEPRDSEIISKKLRGIETRSFMRGKIFVLEIFSKLEIDSELRRVIEKYSGEIEVSNLQTTLMLVEN